MRIKEQIIIYMEIDLNKLSKIISQILRHEPFTYGLTLDSQGWVSLQDLTVALNFHGIRIDINTIIKMVEQSEKKRHQILSGKIRAYYGHSIEGKILKKSSEPPEFLCHGTRQDNLNSIMEVGILPMDRQYVHLSIDEETAKMIGSRKKGKLAVLKVKAREAHSHLIRFYKEDNGIWLSDLIPPQWVMLQI